MRLVDEVVIRVASGHGGPGAVSFRREAMTPRGGPDGGDGGRGGDIVLRASPNLSSLMEFKPLKLYAAENGQAGAGANCSGRQGNDLVLMVPVGTLVRDEESQEVLADLNFAGEVRLLMGGRGGKGNAFFKTSVNQAPEHAQPGEPGVAKVLKLELKMIADVGIIGFPNAGKSTLISRISAARPKIADYPFTTLTPNLGVVRISDEESFVVADIPGLIEGAHLGSGLGIQFLKHIERTKIFIHLVDASGFRPQDPSDDYAAINFELAKYDELNAQREGFFPLRTRPQIVVLTKIDVLAPDELKRKLQEFEKKTGVSAMALSAVTGQGLKELLMKMWQTLQAERVK